MRIATLLFCVAFVGYFVASLALMVFDPTKWKKARWIERGLLDRYDVEGNEDDRRTIVRLGAMVLTLLFVGLLMFLANVSC